MITSETNRKQNVEIDSEGGAKATGGPDKYVAPLVLGLFAASASLGDDDNVVKNGVVGNGFGLMTRSPRWLPQIGTSVRVLPITRWPSPFTGDGSPVAVS